MTERIVPIREYFENPVALAAAVADLPEVERLVVFAFRADGSMRFETTSNVSNGNLAYCSVVAAFEATHSTAVQK
jgi:hypothetical protein